MFSTIKIVLFVFKVATSGEESTSFWDTIFSLFIALYAIQSAAAKGINLGKKGEEGSKNDQTLEDKLISQEKGGFALKLAKLLSDRGIVLVILGIVLGYHTMQIQTILGNSENYLQSFSLFKGEDIVILGHEVNLMITLIIYVFSLIAFLLLPSFRRYANPEINRIAWLPPYDELKSVISNIKSGEVAWKMDVTKLLIGMGKDKLAAKFGRKKKKTTEARFTETWKKLRGKKD